MFGFFFSVFLEEMQVYCGMGLLEKDDNQNISNDRTKEAMRSKYKPVLTHSMAYRQGCPSKPPLSVITQGQAKKRAAM